MAVRPKRKVQWHWKIEGDFTPGTAVVVIGGGAARRWDVPWRPLIRWFELQVIGSRWLRRQVGSLSYWTCTCLHNFSVTLQRVTHKKLKTHGENSTFLFSTCDLHWLWRLQTQSLCLLLISALSTQSPDCFQFSCCEKSASCSRLKQTH